MKNGFLITFEGGEGCGKSTQVDIFEKRLKDNGIDYIRVREPGGTQLGEIIRKILLQAKDIDFTPIAELFLYETARAELVQRIINPALKDGKVVLLDRFYDSSVAYQGYARGLGAEYVKNLSEIATTGLKPDVTFYLRLDVNEAFLRIQDRELDKMECLDKAFHEKVKYGYDYMAKIEEPDRFYVIDASLTIDEISKQIWNEFTNRFAKKREIH